MSISMLSHNEASSKFDIETVIFSILFSFVLVKSARAKVSSRIKAAI